MKRRIKLGAVKRITYTTAIAIGLSAGAYGIASATTNTATTTTANTVSATTPANPASLGNFAGPGHRGPGRRMMMGLAGTVTSVSSSGFVLSTANGTSINVTTTSATTYHEQGVSTQPTSVSQGQRVSIRPTQPTGSTSTPTTSVTAAAVEIQVPSLAGKVVSANSSAIVVQDRQGFYRTIDLSSATTYSVGGGTATSTDAVTANENIVAYGTISSDHTQLDATAVQTVLPHFGGTVSNPSSTGFTLTNRSGTAYTVVVNSATKYVAFGSTSASLSSVTAGSRVMVEGTISGSTITATSVGIAPSGGPGGGPAGFFQGGQPPTPQGATA